jgi:hypothetical protein
MCFQTKAKCAVICCTRIGTSHICWIKILSRWWIQLQEFDPLQLSGSPATLKHELLQQRFYPWGPEHDWKRMKVHQLGQSWVSHKPLTMASSQFVVCCHDVNGSHWSVNCWSLHLWLYCACVLCLLWGSGAQTLSCAKLRNALLFWSKFKPSRI